MATVAIVCNGSEPSNIFPPLIIGSSAVASGDELILFFTPGGGPVMTKGKLEQMKGLKGLPDPVELYEGIVELGAKILVCELALDAKDLKKEDFRDGVEIVGATFFINEIKDATITFSF
jgi:predicted peroxiredoxin